MNSTYRSIWNEALGAWVAASELCTARGKKSSSSVLTAGLLAAVICGSASSAWGANECGVVASGGTVTCQGDGTPLGDANPNTTGISYNTDNIKVIVDGTAAPFTIAPATATAVYSTGSGAGNQQIEVNGPVTLNVTAPAGNTGANPLWAVLAETSGGNGNASVVINGAQITGVGEYASGATSGRRAGGVVSIVELALTHSRKHPMQTNHTPRHLVLAAAALAGLALSGCGSLHDERYNWCQGQNCAIAQVVTPAPDAPAAPAPVPTTRRVDLSTDALFAFDRSGASDMLPKGRAELDALARALRGQDMRVQSLTITGHTDRLGDDAYNQALSQRRASTVADYLRAQGVGAPMQLKAMGEREPVTTGCKGEVRTAALIACLQPDRRVTVDILGQAK